MVKLSYSIVFENGLFLARADATAARTPVCVSVACSSNFKQREAKPYSPYILTRLYVRSKCTVANAEP